MKSDAMQADDARAFTAPERRSVGRWLPWMLAAALAAALPLVWQRVPSGAPGQAGVMRFTIKLPSDAPAYLELGASLATIWASDGARVVYAARRSGPENLFWRLADGTGQEERLTQSPYVQSPGSFTKDGVLAFTEYRPQTRGDILTLTVTGDRTPTPFLATPFDETSPTFSPDGRLMAYVSDETGVPEVYVQSFPGPSRKTQVSIRGGITPFWRRDGRELVYRDGQRLVAVSVTTTTTTLQVGQPQELLRLPPRTTEVAMAPDGQRFLLVQREGEDLVASELDVVVNWLEELKQRVPVR